MTKVTFPAFKNAGSKIRLIMVRVTSAQEKVLEGMCEKHKPYTKISTEILKAIKEFLAK